MNQLNNLTDVKNENELNLQNCKYRDTGYFKNLTKDFKRRVLSFFHMNVCSLAKNFDDFNILFSELNASFDILAVTESQIKKYSSSPISPQLSNYSIENTPTGSPTGGTLPYVGKILFYQLRNDLRLYDPGKIEATFIPITCSKSTNVMYVAYINIWHFL